MGILVIFYNLMMASVDLAAVLWIRRQPMWRTSLAAACCLAAAAVLAALGLGGHTGRGATLLAWGVFLHGPLVATACGLATWRKHRGLAVACFLAALAVGGVGIDAFWIEPHWLQVTHREIASPKIAQPTRVVIIADPQTDVIDDYLRRAFETALQQEPDLILLAGDYVQCAPDRYDTLAAQFNKLMHGVGLQAPLGVFAVQGNVDNHGRWPVLFANLPVTVCRQTERHPLDRLTLTCLSARDSFTTGTAVPAAENFHIVMGHSPNFALGQIEADLLVAGHTHGGQVQIPLLGPIEILSAIPRRWGSGATDLGRGRTLLVSRGVGMERGGAPLIRFWCRPEIIVLDLKPE